MTDQGTALQLFRKFAGSYDRVVDWATLFQDRYWKRWAAGWIAPTGGLVLDLGCGTLLMEERLSRSGSRFVGIDLTEEMVRAGKAKELGNVPLLVNGDAESLPFSDETFDSVISCYVPKYVRLPKLAGELARVSKPGAVVVLYDFAPPRGPLAPFLGAYIRGGLRVAGFFARLGGAGAAFAYDRLPGVIYGTTWDREVERVMEGMGFETVAAERLTGGVVFGYCGRKRPRT